MPEDWWPLGLSLSPGWLDPEGHVILTFLFPRLPRKPSTALQGSPAFTFHRKSPHGPPTNSHRRSLLWPLLLNGPHDRHIWAIRRMEIFLSLEKCFSANLSSMWCRFLVFVFRWKQVKSERFLFCGFAKQMSLVRCTFLLMSESCRTHRGWGICTCKQYTFTESKIRSKNTKVHIGLR